MICGHCQKLITPESLRADVTVALETVRLRTDENGSITADLPYESADCPEYNRIIHDCGTVFYDKWGIERLCDKSFTMAAGINYGVMQVEPVTESESESEEEENEGVQEYKYPTVEEAIAEEGSIKHYFYNNIFYTEHREMAELAETIIKDKRINCSTMIMKDLADICIVLITAKNSK